MKFPLHPICGRGLPSSGLEWQPIVSGQIMAVSLCLMTQLISMIHQLLIG